MKKIYIFTSLITIFFATTVLAQQYQSIKWPKTFSGQPDFDFTKKQIILDLQKKNAVLPNSKAVITGTVKRLFQTNIINPFKKNSESKEANIEANKINKNALAALFGEIAGNDTYSSNLNAKLPSFNKKKSIDLTDFEEFLENIIKQKASTVKNTLKNRDFSNDLKKISIQSIVRSPIKYTIINNNRFGVGDRFLIPIKSKIYYSELDAILSPYLPQPESLSEDAYNKYVNIKNEAIKKYKSENTSGSANVITHNISVTIRDILHRKVKVSVYGNEYELKLKNAF